MFEDRTTVDIPKPLYDEIISYLQNTPKPREAKVTYFLYELRPIEKKPVLLVTGAKPLTASDKAELEKHPPVVPITVYKTGLTELVHYLKLKGQKGNVQALELRDNINASQQSLGPVSIQINVNPPVK